MGPIIKSLLFLGLLQIGSHDPRVTAVMLRPNERSDIQAGKLPAPSSYESPRFRWWWPGGWIDPSEIVKEIHEISAAGFGGAEIGDVQDSVTVSLDPKIYGWAQPRWNEGVLDAYQAADEFACHLSCKSTH